MWIKHATLFFIQNWNFMSSVFWNFNFDPNSPENYLFAKAFVHILPSVGKRCWYLDLLIVMAGRAQKECLSLPIVLIGPYFYLKTRNRIISRKVGSVVVNASVYHATVPSSIPGCGLEKVQFFIFSVSIKWVSGLAWELNTGWRSRVRLTT